MHWPGIPLEKVGVWYKVTLLCSQQILIYLVHCSQGVLPRDHKTILNDEVDHQISILYSWNQVNKIKVHI